MCSAGFSEFTRARSHRDSHRLGTIGSIDVFEVVALDGAQWDVLYFDLYHPRKSRRAPACYELKATSFEDIDAPDCPQTMADHVLAVRCAAGLIREGLNPLQIADEFGVTLETVLGYLDRAVGEGVLRRSDIYFSFTPDQRAANEGYLRLYADACHALGDMYEDVRGIELKLHTIRHTHSLAIQRLSSHPSFDWNPPADHYFVALFVSCDENRALLR